MYEDRRVKDSKVLTIMSEGIVFAEPNRALVTVGITTENEAANIAQEENAKTTNQVIAALEQFGIDSRNLKTSEYRMNVQYDYLDGKQVFRAYEVVHLLEITLDDSSKAGQVIDIAVKNGANTVTNLQFTVNNHNELYNQALRIALENARKKAKVMTDTLKVKLQEPPLSITEITNSEAVHSPVASFAKSVETPVMAGQIEIKAVIQARFTYSN